MIDIINVLKNTQLVICDSYNYNKMKVIQKKYNFKLLELKFSNYPCSELFIKNKINKSFDNILLISNILTGEDYIKLLLCFYELNNKYKNITLFIPYLGYCRQHKKNISVGGLLISSFKIFKIKEIYLLEPHCNQIFINQTKDLLINIIKPREIFIKYIKALNFSSSDSILISPDRGFEDDIKYFSKYLNIDYIVGDKKRKDDGKVEKIKIKFDGIFKNILIIDDLIDTGDTITNLINKIRKHKKSDLSIFIFCCHGVLSKKPEFLKYKCVKKLILTDSIKIKHKSKKLEILNLL